MKTIPRNHTRKIAAIKASIVKVEFYDQRAGGMKPTTLEAAFTDLYRYDFSKLYDNDGGRKYTVHVHSNLWYYLYTQEGLAHANAHREAIDKRAAQAPARRSDSGQQQAARIAAAESRAKIEALGAELRREDLDPSLRASFIAEHAGLVEPAVTVTRTRKAIGSQIAEACDALGITLGHGYAKGAATYVVNGRDYTAGELADLVLEGGFNAAYGANETRVNWNSPLRPLAQTPTDKVSESLGKLKNAVTKLRTAGTAPADVLEQIEGVMQLMRDELHARAEEEAPVEKIDFPSGAAEPGKDVTAVQCVRTGHVWERDYTSWTCHEIGETTGWYRLNIIDPMSEGFRIYTHAAKAS